MHIDYTPIYYGVSLMEGGYIKHLNTALKGVRVEGVHVTRGNPRRSGLAIIRDTIGFAA